MSARRARALPCVTRERDEVRVLLAFDGRNHPQVGVDTATAVEEIDPQARPEEHGDHAFGVRIESDPADTWEHVVHGDRDDEGLDALPEQLL